LGQSKLPPNPIDPDSYERVILCIKVLSEPDPYIKNILIEQCHASFARLLAEQQKKKPTDTKKKEVDVQADDLIKVRLLRSKRTFGMEDIEDYDDTDLIKATGQEENKEDPSRRLSRVYQLTGFSDPIYAEAYVNVHQYDIVLDTLIINQTSETLQNVCLELATLGDLKLVERPQNLTIAPHDKKQIKANIKVTV
jgi:coatomer subunit beta